MLRATLSLALLWGCSGKESTPSDPTGPETSLETDPETTETDAVDTVDSGTTETADTGTPPPPTVLFASCAPTANVLRFSCAVTVDPPQPVQIRFSRTDGTGIERTHTSEDVASEHEIGLYFMEAETDYTWTAELLGGVEPSVVGSFATDPLPSIANTGLSVLDGASSIRYVGTHQPCNNTATAVIYDTVTGGLVWYETLDQAGTLGFFDMIRFTEDHTVLGETGPSIVEVDLMGNTVLRMQQGTDYSGFYHHDILKHDGYIYAVFQDNIPPLTLDGFSVFDGLGTEVARWTARDYLDIPEDAFGDWMHTNTIWVDDAGDILLSSWSQDSVIKIAGDWTSPDFGTQRWALAGIGSAGFGDDFVYDYAPVGADSFRDQHSVRWTPDGRLLMLDNSHGRALTLDVDQTTFTVVADNEYPAYEPSCGPQGTANILSTGNVFVGCSGSHLKEYTPDGQELWHGTSTCTEGRADSVRWYPLEGW